MEIRIQTNRWGAWLRGALERKPLVRPCREPNSTDTRPSETNHESRQDCGEAKSAARDYAPPTKQKARINCKTKPTREAFPRTPATNSGPIRAHQPPHLVLGAGSYSPLGQCAWGDAARTPPTSRATARCPPGGRGLSLLYREGLGLLVDTPRLLALKRETRGRARTRKGVFENGPAGGRDKYSPGCT